MSSGKRAGREEREHEQESKEDSVRERERLSDSKKSFLVLALISF